ncbi:MAG: universal stress protein, partial [Acidimicrobiales bacterium]
MIEKMVVGVDGSATAAAAARQAAALANLFGAEVVAATASGRLLGVTAERAREQLEGPWTAPLREAAAKHRTVVLEGDPRVMLAELAEEEGADLVVVGSSGVGWYPAARVGHVAHYLAHHGGQPLLIVPGERPAELRRLAVGLDGSEGSAAALDWASDVAAAADGELLGVHVHQPAASAGR